MLSKATDPSPWQGEGGGRGQHLGARAQCCLGTEILHCVQDDKLTLSEH
jgi:hypothetical protein